MKDNNNWRKIEDFFNTNEDIQIYYERVKEKYTYNNCDDATHMIITIEKLLERIQDLEDDLEYLERKLENNET
ncbi:MAG: hypothetical protein ACLTDM_13085 [Clostridium butyricum]